MKQLTKIHLLMERMDLQYVAEQLVDYYELSSKVKMKKGRYKDEKAFYHWHDNTIHIDPSQSAKEFIISVLHEIFHAKQTIKAGGASKMQRMAEIEWGKAANGDYGKRGEKNPYKYVPFEIEAEKWAQTEYRKRWKGNF